MKYVDKTININGTSVLLSKSEHICNICHEKSTQTYYEMDKCCKNELLVKIRQLLNVVYLRLCENCLKDLETNIKAVIIKLELNLL